MAELHSCIVYTISVCVCVCVSRCKHCKCELDNEAAQPLRMTKVSSTAFNMQQFGMAIKVCLHTLNILPALFRINLIVETVGLLQI